MNRDTIWLDIVTERFRQERLCAAGKFPATLAHRGALSPAACLAVLAEEFGEVARPVADQLAGSRRGEPLDVDHLREELIQLAACCVAWVEQLDDVPGIPVVLPYQDAGEGLPLGAFAVQRGAA
ncbi:MAG: MazG-like family protein [Pseudomonadota bacterium]